ncbi:MAG TPA: hypothetical protein VJ828_18290 [Lacipirellulaceae bacterium]|nr:hypothetical protein [Lacipirellulaceae bacterium]
MKHQEKLWLLAALVACLQVLFTAPASMAQVRRYEPSRPTVSPYLNLFRNDGFDNRAIPNYQALVRPLQQQYQTNQEQKRLLLQQNRALQQLNSNVQNFEQRAVTGQLVAPTGKGAWFARPSRRAQFLNTSRYYSQSGTPGLGTGAAAAR